MSEATTLGQRLSAAREQKGLSAQRAADELHLDGWVIQGLESGDYARIGPDVYAKGHLKRYAALLGLSVAEVSAAFDGKSSTSEKALPPGLSIQTSASGDRLPRPQLAGAVIIAAAAVAIMAGMWWSQHRTRTAATQAALAAAPAAPAVPSSGTAANAAVPMASTAQDEAEPPGAAGRARLRLSFLGETWVDVHDAAGQRLFAGQGHLHNVRSLSGEAPFRVYVKAADSIRLEINNHVVAIEPKFVVANVARFEAGADGVLRRDQHAVTPSNTAAPGSSVAPAAAAPRPHG
jgi:cytoskeleton protein RodZ